MQIDAASRRTAGNSAGPETFSFGQIPNLSGGRLIGYFHTLTQQYGSLLDVVEQNSKENATRGIKV